MTDANAFFSSPPNSNNSHQLFVKQQRHDTFSASNTPSMGTTIESNKAVGIIDRNNDQQANAANAFFSTPPNSNNFNSSQVALSGQKSDSLFAAQSEILSDKDVHQNINTGNVSAPYINNNANDFFSSNNKSSVASTTLLDAAPISAATTVSDIDDANTFFSSSSLQQDYSNNDQFVTREEKQDNTTNAATKPSTDDCTAILEESSKNSATSENYNHTNANNFFDSTPPKSNNQQQECHQYHYCWVETKKRNHQQQFL